MLRLVLSGLMGALLVVSKQAMSGLPNIEPVTLLVILFALELPRETPGAVTVFILLQGVLYGFGLWWAMYLYVWYLLALLAWLLRRMDNALGWAVFSGIYGLCFGGLCAAVYLVAKTPAFALSWWLSGLSYDAMHGMGNFVIMLLLYRPLRRAASSSRMSFCMRKGWTRKCSPGPCLPSARRIPSSSAAPVWWSTRRRGSSGTSVAAIWWSSTCSPPGPMRRPTCALQSPSVRC